MLGRLERGTNLYKLMSLRRIIDVQVFCKQKLLKAAFLLSGEERNVFVVPKEKKQVKL